MKKLVVVCMVALMSALPIRAAGLMDRVMDAAGLGGDLGDVFLEGAFDAALQALFERTRVVGAKMEAPLGVALVTPAMPIELRADSGSFDQVRRVEQAFQQVLKVNANQAMQYALEDKALQQLIEAGLKSAFARAGCLEVLTADEIRQWTSQRRDERANSEVRQGSLPAKGTLERPFMVARWRWIPLAGVDYESWWHVVTTRNILELTSQLSISLQLADSGLTVATFVVPVEVRAVGGGQRQSRSTYGRPFVHAMMTRATDHLGGMLETQVRTWDQVCLGRLKLPVGPQEPPVVETTKQPAASALPKLVPAEGLPRYRVFGVYQRHAVLTMGQEEGLVGSGDAANLPAGSSVWVGGYEFKLIRTARRLSLVALDGQPLEAQEAISRPDVPVTWPNMPQPARQASGAAAAPAPSPAIGDSVPVTILNVE